MCMIIMWGLYSIYKRQGQGYCLLPPLNPSLHALMVFLCDFINSAHTYNKKKNLKELFLRGKNRRYIPLYNWIIG